MTDPYATWTAAQHEATANRLEAQAIEYTWLYSADQTDACLEAAQQHRELARAKSCSSAALMAPLRTLEQAKADIAAERALWQRTAERNQRDGRTQG